MAIQPGVKYQWPDDSIFQLSGNEFSSLFMFLESYVNSSVYQTSIAAGQLHNILLKKFEIAVESGLAKPVQAPEEIVAEVVEIV